MCREVFGVGLKEGVGEGWCSRGNPARKPCDPGNMYTLHALVEKHGPTATPAKLRDSYDYVTLRPSRTDEDWANLDQDLSVLHLAGQHLRHHRLPPSSNHTADRLWKATTMHKYKQLILFHIRPLEKRPKLPARQRPGDEHVAIPGHSHQLLRLQGRALAAHHHASVDQTSPSGEDRGHDEAQGLGRAET